MWIGENFAASETVMAGGDFCLKISLVSRRSLKKRTGRVGRRESEESDEKTLQ
jgi:hypothetical protein